jgi:threonylcarbamoyladenosine tRNA methylthiotransferase MtaB
MRAAVLGFGCRLNASETEAMAEALSRAGTQIGDVADADVVIVNGCTITHEADRDAAAAVRRVARSNPSARIVVTGCYAESAAAQAAALPGVVAVIGNAAKPDIVAHVARAVGSKGSVDAAPDVEIGRLRRGVPLRVLPPVAHARARALLKVQDGCDYRCSFCIVPSVRGPSRSLTTDEIVLRTRGLVEAGVAEVVLTGVHLGTWGRDHGHGRGALAGLVAALLPVLGGARLRLSSVDPHEVDGALLDLLAGAPDRLCRHLHLPVQSCDDGVLSRMRRGHRADDFTTLVREATSRIPGLAISTDVIVGFPGEDDAAFNRTRDVLASLPLAYLHVFPYSVRRGTAAAQMSDAVPPAVIRARAAALRAVSEAHAARFRQAQVGRVLDVVVHRGADRRGQWWARSDHDVALRVGDAAAHAGCRVAARVGADGFEAQILA